MRPVLVASIILVSWLLLYRPERSEALDEAFPHREPAFWVLTFSPDGRYVAAGTDTGLDLWEVKSGAQVWRLPEVDEARVGVIAFSPDSKMVAATGVFGSDVYVIDVESGEELTRFATPLSSPVYSLVFSPNGRKLAVGAFDGGVGIYSTDAWRLENSWKARERLVRVLRYTADGTGLLVATPSEVTLIREPMLNAATSYKIGRGDVRALTLSPDGKMVHMAVGDGSIHGWLFAEDKVALPLNAHRKSADGVLELPNGQLVTVGGDGYLRVWDIDTGKKIFEQFLGRTIPALGRSPDGSVVATGGPTVRFWKTKDWLEIPFPGRLRDR
jgi:WD40 repeat protein